MGEGHSDAEQEAAWQFVQFVNQPENQALWHTGTGYFPVAKAALEEPTDGEWREEHPQFDVAVQQVQDTELSTAAQGCSAGVMPKDRKAVEDALEAILQGGDAQEEVKATERLQPELEDYKSAVS